VGGVGVEGGGNVAWVATVVRGLTGVYVVSVALAVVVPPRLNRFRTQATLNSSMKARIKIGSSFFIINYLVCTKMERSKRTTVLLSPLKNPKTLADIQPANYSPAKNPVFAVIALC
jgi:hypothetical protein